MQAHDAKSTSNTPTTLTAAQVADRMGLTTRQLQDLRLRGIGPPIVQRGLSIHYQLADVQEIERHEAAMLMEQVLASNRPLALLRAMAESAGLKLSPILQQVAPPSSLAMAQVETPAVEPLTAKPAAPTSPAIEVWEPQAVAHTNSMPAPSPPSAPPTLTVITSPTTAWYLVHTKPRQEDVALANLERQGYECYLPQLRIERNRIQDWRDYFQQRRPGHAKLTTISCLTVALLVVILEFITQLVVPPSLRRKGFKSVDQGLLGRPC
jgi:hypothetical protein